MTDTAFQADAFQGDAFQIASGGEEGGGGSTPAAPAVEGDGYTYIPSSRTAKKIRKLLRQLGEPLAMEPERPVVYVDPVDIPWPEGFRVRKETFAPPKPVNPAKWWTDAQAPPALPKADKFEWWDKTAKPTEPQWQASGKSKFEWWKN
jgi:hypothetical protein